MEREQIYRITNSGKIIPVGELVRCKDCGNKECDSSAGRITCRITGDSHGRLWYCADAEPKDGEHNADGQGEVSGRLAADRAGSEGESRMDLPGLQNAVPETGGTV